MTGGGVHDALNEARFRAMIEHSSEGIFLLGADGTILYASPSADRLLGAQPGALLGARALDLVFEDDREAVVAQGLALRRNPSTPLMLEYRCRRLDGEVRWLERVGTNLLGVPPVNAIVANFRDITERKLAEAALRQSERSYQRIVANISEGLWLYDAQGNTTFMNAQMAEMLGVPLELALGRPIYSFMDAAGAVEARQRIERRKRGEKGRGELRLVRSDGSDLWVSLHADPLFDGNGAFEGSLALLADVTERRRADETRALLVSIVESSGDAIFSRKLDGTIQSWNRGAERLTQYTAAEAIGQPIAMLYPPEMAAALDARRGHVDQGNDLDGFEMVVVRRDGSRVDVTVSSTVLTSEEGVVLGVSIVARDISERTKAAAALRRTEEQLRQAQKLEAVGSLAGGVAHDFNNLLTVILSYTEMIVEDLKPADPLRADLMEVREAGRRAMGLTRQLLAFSRKQLLEPVVMDLNEVVTGTQKMLGRVLGEDVELSLVLAARPMRTFADIGQIEQVIMNLVVNARDAMPTGGSLTIETGSETLDAAGAESWGLSDGGYVVLTIADTGSGMDPATQARIFEPFFTTKDKSKGTGLGLSTVYGIVQQSGGHVSLDSEPGSGTTFKIYLPRTDRQQSESIPVISGDPIAGTETILLVEDDGAVRALLRTILRKRGYRVLEAENAGEAFLVSEQTTSPIHLLITDIVMPRLSGRQLAERLGPLRPEMKVLFVSGYTDDAIVRHGVIEAGIEFLAKPITPDALLRKVRQVLDGRVHCPT